MKKSIFMFALATLMSASVLAQDNDAKRLPGYKTTFEGNGFWNNWFMSANFGAQSLFAENSKDAKFRNTITFMPTLSVGKWFNPYWGVRLQGTGGSLHGFTSGANSMLHYQYGAVHADFMFGLINFFAPYKENRRFDIVPFAGIGGAFIRKGDQSFTINAGIQARYRISKRFDINVEYQGAILDDDMVVRGGFPNDGISGLTAGVTFRFGKTGFKKGYSSRQYNAIKSNYSDLEANYATLKKENAAQRAEIAELKARKPEIVKEETIIDNSEIKALPSTITFPFNSSKIELSQEVSIFNIAEFLKANPEIRVRLTGYADKRGSEQANRIVSERRANAVTEVFVNKYGIAKDRITTEFKGTSTKFENDDWNRAVVVELIK